MPDSDDDMPPPPKLLVRLQTDGLPPKNRDIAIAKKLADERAKKPSARKDRTTVTPRPKKG